jgi:hypothetical protein
MKILGIGAVIEAIRSLRALFYSTTEAIPAF